MLPSFPKIEAFRGSTNRQMIEQLAAQFSPLLRAIDRHVQFEGRQTKIVRHDDTVGQSSPEAVTAVVSLPRHPLVDFTEEGLLTHLKNFAEQIARGASANFYTEMERATTEVGNVVDAKGQPLNEELILKAIEKMEHSFEPDGTWNPPTLIVPPSTFDRLMQNANAGGSGSADFERLLKIIVEKKRDDFRRREADRVLAG